ncbi:hypothetical protein LNV23_03730 [Paucibacter sp. DJ1R-11]|uniref:hypothetical protein n=1 Tax=Paucibacter sp. DJ1R-11 TaxID=2893556 RepID=UPI0021E43372|nr:hypothetical protein [Paucibacter sp. DJ1R-11]MCV2362557.1 hypothetical protein [Paucibacter sp. DJ1R-11]
MQTFKMLHRCLPLIFATALAAACGGGGGDHSPEAKLYPLSVEVQGAKLSGKAGALIYQQSWPRPDGSPACDSGAWRVDLSIEPNLSPVTITALIEGVTLWNGDQEVAQADLSDPNVDVTQQGQQMVLRFGKECLGTSLRHGPTVWAVIRFKGQAEPTFLRTLEGTIEYMR